MYNRSIQPFYNLITFYYGNFAKSFIISFQKRNTNVRVHVIQYTNICFLSSMNKLNKERQANITIKVLSRSAFLIVSVFPLNKCSG